MTDETATISAATDASLDAALTRALLPPIVPADFRERLRAALARAGDTESLVSQRARLEREHRQQLAELEYGYLRLRRRTLTVLIGGICTMGAGTALLFPLLSAAFGANAVAAVAMFGGIVGVAIGAGASRLRPAS